MNDNIIHQTWSIHYGYLIAAAQRVLDDLYGPVIYRDDDAELERQECERGDLEIKVREVLANAFTDAEKTPWSNPPPCRACSRAARAAE